nr:uncharacterized protein LOC110384197 [Helicoverpa armigera]
MIIYLSMLSISLLLITHSVTSAALARNKRVPRRHIQFTRSCNYNHNPTAATRVYNPINAYEDDEDIKAKDMEKRAVRINEDVMNLVSKGKTLNHGASSGNNPFYDMFPFAIGKDYEENVYLKPRARSIVLPGKSYISRGPDITSETMEKRGRKIRRSSYVRKLRVDKRQLSAYINETEKVLKSNSEDVVNENSVPNTQNFKRRKQLRDPVVPIIDSENYVYSHSGNFHYSYEGGDGTKAYERGELRKSNGGAGSAVEGNFSYKGKDGNDYSLSYTADERGYRPVGDHLPTPPPIPPAIQRALAYLATKPTSEPITERNLGRKLTLNSQNGEENDHLVYVTA